MLYCRENSHFIKEALAKIRLEGRFSFDRPDALQRLRRLARTDEQFMSVLKIYNTLAREKQAFSPIEPGKVRMYVCGMTVYDYCHVGHARVMVVFDIVQRWLRSQDYDVTYVRNITDIDDKIIKRAVENKESISQLTGRFIAALNEDAEALGVERPDQEPRATAYVPQMLSMIGRLEKNGLAYKAADGDVNYSVRDFPGYGKLSGKSLDDLRAGERVDVNTGKRDPLDFVLWKSSRESEPEEVKWESPWGRGRPGWHIECSAMACDLLGEQFDIHGGGQDLQFPHHENEIAQSEGANQHPFVNYWMHNGFVRIDNQKMSKSLGNFFTIREVLKQYDAEVVRFFIARAHYRTPLNYSDAHLDDARGALSRLYTALKDVAADSRPLDWSEPHALRFAEAMNDDFNTPIAVAVLFDLANEINRERSPALARQLKALGGVLGLLQRSSQEFMHAGRPGVSGGIADADVALQIEARTAAKRAKNFAEADRIRNELLTAGVVLEDRPGGLTEWRRA
ncbi:MAG: cysteine--tRNA ligase [Herminiimonas sp.]|nr:cysteine--tRNA ligase [Herminiimonas sp.]MDB5854826.1 cysteine--tRNA ligase [Herminiimonas sp.]